MDLKLKDNSQLNIPYFHRVSCIEIQGNQDIDTGVNFSFVSNLGAKGIKMTIQVLENQTTRAAIYTASNGVSSNMPCFQLVSVDDSITNYLAYSYTNANTSGTAISFEDKTTIESNCQFGTNKSYIKVNNVNTYLPATNAGNRQYNLKLFVGDLKILVWGIEIYGPSGTVRNYIPGISYEQGHIGEACLYDTITNTFKYSVSTGSFTAKSTSLASVLTSAYIKDCPNISGINLLRSCINLNRVRVDIGTQSGTVAELYKYAAYAGFNDAYENQTKPRLVGTWTISDYWANDELSYLQSAFDGLTISYDSNKNVETLLENGDMAVQTLDSSKPNYNPAVSIILQTNGYGRVLSVPIIEGETGRWFLSKEEASSISDIGFIFRQVVDVVDTDGIVSSDTTAEYEFTSFDELQYFGITSIANGTAVNSGTPTIYGGFGGCTKLESITLPDHDLTIGNLGFYNCNKIINIDLGKTTSIGTSSFYNLSSINSLIIPCNVNVAVFTKTAVGRGTTIGNGSGNLIINGYFSSSQNANPNHKLNFRNIIIYGNAGNSSGNSYYYINTPAVVRVKGIFRICTNSSTTFATSTSPMLDVLGDITTTGSKNLGTVTNIHLGYTSVISANPSRLSLASGKHVYIGQGLSRTDDEALLALYNADANWANYLTYLSTWYDYNGEYKTYYITDNLTNCTNTNPDAWPHITRGESYETVLVPDEGYSLQNSHVTIEMLDTDTTSSTYDTMVDITSICVIGYSLETGEVIIRIPSVTGNVIITASAS